MNYFPLKSFSIFHNQANLQHHNYQHHQQQKSHQQSSFQPLRRKFKSKTQLESSSPTTNEFAQENHGSCPSKNNACNDTITEGDIIITQTRNDQRFMTQNLTPLCSYYASSQEYLQQMLQQQSSEYPMNTVDPYEKSNNFIKKDSFCSKPSTTADDHCANYDGLNIDCGNDEGDQFDSMNGYFSNKNCDNNSPNNSNLNYNSNTNAYHHMNFQMPISFPINKPMPINIQMPMMGQIGFNGINKNPNLSPSQINNSHYNNFYNDPCLIEMFGRIGWICTICNNFNYESRFECNRCKNDKTAKIMRPKLPLAPNTNNNNNNHYHKEQQQESHMVMMNCPDSPLAININNNMITNSNNSNNSTTNNCNNLLINNSNNSNIFNQIDIAKNRHSNTNASFIEEDPLSIDYAYNDNSNNINSNYININDCNSSIKKRIKQPFKERIGDWICSHCKNLNFSFRNECNRCYKAKDE